MKKFVHKRCAICRSPVSPKAKGRHFRMRNALCASCLEAWGGHIKEPWLRALVSIEKNNFLYDINMPEILPLEELYTLTPKPLSKL